MDRKTHADLSPGFLDRDRLPRVCRRGLSLGLLFCLSCSPAARPKPVSASPVRLDGDPAAGRAPALAADRTTTESAGAVNAAPTERLSLESCSVEHSGPNVVILHCGKTVLKVMRPETLDFEALLTHLDPTEWKRQTVDLAGASR